uniref:Putative secreted protein n=1 Tax=Amblyomma cajennense TaxID=34607 RepID=A0A023FBU5_AMBCJ
MRAAYLAILIIIVLVGISTIDARGGRYPWNTSGPGSCRTVGGYCATPGRCHGTLSKAGSCGYRHQWCCIPRRQKPHCRSMGGFCAPQGQCRGARLNTHWHCSRGRQCCVYA